MSLTENTIPLPIQQLSLKTYITLIRKTEVFHILILESKMVRTDKFTKFLLSILHFFPFGGLFLNQYIGIKVSFC